MEHGLISVIVPVYNIEKYLERCVESIVKQTYTNLEILLVDDGSTDRSGEICDQFAGKDPRIRVIHKENGGPSDARNAALDIAGGELLTFVDGDDFLSPECIEWLWYAKENSGAQIACCLETIHKDKYNSTDVYYENYSDEKVSVYSRTEALEKLLRQSEYNASPCGKLYDRQLFCDVRYPKGLLYEDLGTTYKIFAKADKVALIRINGYMYFMRDGSIQQSRFTKAKAVELQLVKEQKLFLDEKFPELESATADRLVSSCFHVLFGIYGNGGGKTEFLREQDETKRIIRKNRAKLVKDKNTSKKTRLGCLLSYLGFNATYFVYKLFGIRGRMIS